MDDTGLFPETQPLCWCVSLEQRPGRNWEPGGGMREVGRWAEAGRSLGLVVSAAAFSCSHDFIGEFTTSYRELARGQSQFNIYEVRRTLEVWALL